MNEGNKQKYDPKALTGAAVNLYHLVTGDKADAKTEARIAAGIEGFLQLKDQDPKLAYGVANLLAPMVDKYMANLIGTDTKFDYGHKVLGDIAKLFEFNGEK
jgi:hypothetical protein